MDGPGKHGAGGNEHSRPPRWCDSLYRKCPEPTNLSGQEAHWGFPALGLGRGEVDLEWGVMVHGHTIPFVGDKSSKNKWCWWWFYNPINTLKLFKLYALKG